MTEGRWIAEPLHRTEIDGVPVLWRQGPGPLQASLVVRTGLADETFTTNGLTHLVEHLVMRRVGPRPIEVNASVGLLFTEFTATGSPAAVASFVTDVCGVLRDVAAAEPADLAGDVAAELRVLDVEEGGGGPPGGLLALRFGAVGHGLAGFRPVAQHVLRPVQVREQVRSRFVAGQAVLVLDGPPPSDLRLGLPEGPPLPLPRTRERSMAGHCLDEAAPGVAVGLLAQVPSPTDREALAAAVRIAGRRAEQLVRHDLGLAYDVDGDLTLLDAGRAQAALWADCRDRDAPRVLRELVGVLESVGDSGPTADELAFDVASAHEALRDARGVFASLEGAARDLLVGLPLLTEAERLAVVEGLSADDVAASVRLAARTVQALVPEDVRVDLPGWRRAPASTVQPVEGRVLRRRLLSWAPRGSRLVHQPGTGVSYLHDDEVGGHRTARWPDVVGVGVDGDGVHVVQTADGEAIPVRVKDFHGGQPVLDDLLAHVPAELVFGVPADE
ncbi:peptidase M16 family protein [Angustibacter aerolatus]